MNATNRLGAAVAVVVSMVLGCGGGAPEGGAYVVTQALSTADVARVSVTITGAGIAPAIVLGLTGSGQQWGGVVGQIPAGPGRTFVAEVFDAAGTKLYEGQAMGVTIVHGQTAMVAIVAQQVAPPTPFQNAAPINDSLVASANEVPPGAVIALAATAHDQNPGDTLTYAWQAPAGVFDRPTEPSTNWTAPIAEGAYALRITVTDQRGAASSMILNATVSAQAGRGKAAVLVSLNTTPQLMGVSANPTRLDVGQSAVLNAAASDADGDVLTYAWSTPCAGTFSDAAIRNPTFTLSALPAAGSCALRVSVSDGRGGANTGEIVISTGSGPAPNLAPQVASMSQSAATANAGETVTLRVDAYDPEGGNLSFSWSAANGSLGTAMNAAGGSQVLWTAPPCFRAGTAAVIDVSISDGGSIPTAVSFSVDAGGVEGSCASGSPAPLAYWTFDNDTADDTVGTNHGTISGATFAAGKVGRAASFDASAFIRVPSMNVTSITVEAWVRSSKFGYYTSMVTKSYHQNSWANPWAAWQLWFDNTSAQPGFFWGDPSTSNYFSCTSPESVPGDQWLHLAGTYDGTTVKVFVNGVEKASCAGTGPLAQTTGDVFFGKTEPSNHTYVGLLDEIAIFDRALTPQQIGQHYQRGVAGMGLGPF